LKLSRPWRDRTGQFDPFKAVVFVAILLPALWTTLAFTLGQLGAGVAAFAYALSHLLLYVTEQSFDFGTIASEIIARAFLTIGFAGLVGLSILAATSTDEMMKYLGGRRWRRHRLVYVSVAHRGDRHLRPRRPYYDADARLIR
jgi:sulfoxide reductase heme-binding subunit YedZ